MKINFDTDKFSNDKCIEIAEMIDFYAKCLMPLDVKKKLVIDLETNKKLDVQGQCTCEDVTSDPRWFTISIRGKRGDDDLEAVLAHEMVHVKQYAMNEMYKCMIMNRGKTVIATKWYGDIWEPKEGEDEYFDNPWEIEAFGREVELVS